MNFVSESNIARHKEYLRELKLRMSIFEKSYPDMQGAALGGIMRARAARSERELALRLKAEINAHELYFSSFGNSGCRSEKVRSAYGSEAAFLYRLLCECREARGGFLFVFAEGRGVDYYVGEEYARWLVGKSPILALDLCEHAYFMDYGFHRDDYLKAALSRLNLSKMENRIEKTENK